MAARAQAEPPAALDPRRRERDPLSGLWGASLLVFAIQVGGAGAAFAQQVVLARVLGASEYGLYTYLYLYVGWIALLAGLGMPAAAIRFLPEYRASGREEERAAFLASARRLTWRSSLAAAMVAAAVALVLAAIKAIGDPWPIVVGACLIPLLAGSILATELARAEGRMALAYLAPQLVRPALTSVAVLCLSMLLRLRASEALAATLACAAMTLVLQSGSTFAGRATRPGVSASASLRATWRGAGLGLLAVSMFVIVLMQLDIAIVATLLGNRAGGVYAAASKTAALVSFAAVAINAVAAPRFAALWKGGRHAELQSLLGHLATMMLWTSLALAMGIALLATPLLGLFGHGFVEARTALLVLLCGQVVNAAAGPVGYLLTLTGEHRAAAGTLAWCTAAFCLLAVAGTLAGGMTGAAIGSAAGFLLWNVALCRLAWLRLSMWPAALPRPKAPRRA